MLELIIPMPALSMNHSHMVLKRGGRIKTPQTRIYELQFSHHLAKFSQQIAAFIASFNNSEMGVSVNYQFYFPKQQYYTKKGKLNLKKLPDTDNLIKITQDLIFARLMDDSYVIELTACKLPTDRDSYIKVKLQAIPLPTLPQ